MHLFEFFTFNMDFDTPEIGICKYRVLVQYQQNLFPQFKICMYKYVLFLFFGIIFIIFNFLIIFGG